MRDRDRLPFRKRRRKPTEAELLAWRDLSRDPTEFWKVPFDPCPYVSFNTPSGAPGIEMGIKGTF